MRKKVGLFVLMALVCVFAFSANVNAATEIYCSAIPDARIDASIPDLVSTIIKIIQIVVPVILVVLGLIDFVKAVSAQKEDEIKKGQQTFIKRIIAAALVFFIIAIVKLVISLVASNSDEADIMQCVDCFLYGSDHAGCSREANDPASNASSNQNASGEEQTLDED